MTACMAVPKGKRETGEKPVRSRHCDAESVAGSCAEITLQDCTDPYIVMMATGLYREGSNR